MASSFPTSLQDLDATRGTASDSLSTVNHVTHHALEDDTIEALQAKVGADGSAVTTSHDYKLSGVATGDKAVSLTGTETLTNKTLTSPQINFGTNATGDIYYRNGDGTFTRLPVGSADQILAVQSGLPAWIANPSATAATDTTAGIVELATTAETTTGTATDRAVTPDGLHDMTSLAGAAWFLDEDTMSSDSATKVASQQSIKAYVDAKASLNDVPNTSTSHASWFTWEMPILSWYTGGPDYEPAGWIEWQYAEVYNGKGAGYANIGLSNNGGSVVTDLPGTGSVSEFKFSAGKKWRAKFYAKINNSTAVWGIGLVMGTGTFYPYIYEAQTTTSRSMMRLVFNSSSTYLANSDGTNYTANSVTVTRTNWNLYTLYFDGTNLYCYVNGTLAATNSTNLPTASTDGCYFAIGGDTISTGVEISPIIFSLEM